MKTKLTLILMLLGLAGCQQQSEIDKCVEAQAKTACSSLQVDFCKERAIELYEGDYRLKCLKAQAGKE